MNLYDEIIDSMTNHPEDWEIISDSPNHKKYDFSIGENTGNIYGGSVTIHAPFFTRRRLLKAVRNLQKLHDKTPKKIADFQGAQTLVTSSATEHRLIRQDHQKLVEHYRTMGTPDPEGLAFHQAVKGYLDNNKGVTRAQAEDFVRRAIV